MLTTANRQEAFDQMEWGPGLLPLDRRIARFRVASKADELGFPTLSHRENHVVTM